MFDIGTHSTKAGYAGEDTPKGVYPSVVGARPLEQQAAMEVVQDTDGPAPPKKAQTVFTVGTQSITHPRADVHLRRPLKDGLVDDWEAVEQLLSYGYKHVLRCESNDRPIMLAEPAWNTRELREKMLELLFEKYQVPALFFCKAPVLSAFAAGRSTALVLDVGASGASAVPVYDGMVLLRGVKRNALGGDFLTEEYRNLLEGSLHVPIVPSYLVAKRYNVPEGQPARFDKRSPAPAVTPSFHDFMCQEVVRDFYTSVARVSDHPYSEQALSGIPTTHFEFPSGFNANYGLERYRIPEAFFDPKHYAPTPVHAGHAGLVTDSIRSCDIDAQQALWGSVVLSGGCTLLTGYVDRFHNELARATTQGNKYKVLASSSSHERMFSAWIGGSILASLGSFQQMWFSRAEYDEQGKGALERKCP